MRKMYKGLIAMALLLSLMVTVLPMGVWAQSEGLYLQITPSVSNAKVGDVIEYTVTATGSDILALEFKLTFPEGLSYVENSAQVPEGLADRLGWAEADWTEETKKWTGYNDSGMDIPAGTQILTFCAVAQEEGTHRVEMINIYPYNGSFCEVEAVVTLDDVTVTADTQPTAPVFTATAKEGGMVLTWDATGIIKTWIYMGTSENDLKPTYSTTNGSYTVSNLDHNQTYYVRLAHNINGQILMSENVLAVKPLAPQYPAKISGLKAGNIQETAFTLTWDEVPGIDKYFIFLNGVTYTSTVDASVTVVNRKAGRSYDVQVIASVGGKMVQALKDADVLSVKTLEKQVTAPVFTATGKESSVVLTWDATGITKTWIYMGTSANDLKPTYSTTNGSYTVSNLDHNQTYYFQLAHSINGQMKMSENVQAVKPLAPPYPAKISGLKAGNIQETSFTLTWDAIPGIEKYFIFLNGVTYTSTADASVTVVNRKVDRVYEVQVLASVGGKMVQTLQDADVLSVKTAQKQPQIPVFSGSVLSGKVVLSWDTTDVTKTWIYMGTSADDLKPTYSTTNGSFTVSGLEANTTYYFKLYHNIGGKVVTSEQILEITT